MKRLIALLLVCICIIFALPPEVEKSIKPTDYLIINKNNVDDIWRLRPSPNSINPQYIILTADIIDLESAMHPILKNYVSNGHGLLILSQRETNLLFDEIIVGNKKHITNSGVSFVINDDFHDNPILTSVKKIKLSRAQSSKKYFETSPGDKGDGILIYENDSRKPSVLAYLYGAGRIIYSPQNIASMPIIQNPSLLNEYDNHRFAVNVDQWLAGYPVPGSGNTSSMYSGVVNNSPKDRIVLKNGDVISGDIQNNKFSIKTSYADVSFERKAISNIILEGGGMNIDAITLSIGDRLSGVLLNPSVKIILQTGDEVEISKDKIKEITITPK